jgi:hypothetical protein
VLVGKLRQDARDLSVLLLVAAVRAMAALWKSGR